MKILKAEVINYKSLGKAVVEFGNLTIFIGKNSHGKSNFIEALYLFFNEFEPRIQNNVNNIPKELWTGKEIDNFSMISANPVPLSIPGELMWYAY